MSDHEQTLRDVERLKAVARLYQTIPGMSPTRAEQDATAAACLAGADALVRAKQTCGTCKHRSDWPDAIGCNNGRGLNRDEVSHGDFCSEWATREAE